MPHRPFTLWRVLFALTLLPQTITAATPPNLSLIGAPIVWARGFTGQGIVVAILDSGVDLTHPELAARWRGGANSWFDPYQEHSQPVDLTGHGTQMLGVIVGGAASGTQIGVAPDAQWIAARIFDDRGQATTAAIHAALRWVLDPDGNPTTADAPHVLNASWSGDDIRCNLEFAADLQALHQAGILPVFAAGTHTPISPATLPTAFPVGAIDDAEHLYFDSARGPSPCATPEDYFYFPRLVAPGVNIRTTDKFGLYTEVEGTSVAAAHVAGTLALLLSARPGLSAAEQAEVLQASAADLGVFGPDQTFGYGRLDVARAVDRALNPTMPGGVLAAIILLSLLTIALWLRRTGEKP